MTKPLRSVTWNGVTYDSITEAAKANGLTPAGMSNRLAAGYTCDADLKRPAGTPRPCKWNGVRYASQQEAAEANNVPAPTMRSWLRKGYKRDEDIPERTVVRQYKETTLSGLEIWAQRARNRREREAGRRWVQEEAS